MARPGEGAAAPKPVSLKRQSRALLDTYDRVRVVDLTQMYGEWILWLQPDRTSPLYRLRLHYRRGHPPLVWLEEPALERDAPHVNDRRSGELCLYFPGDGTWQSSMLLAEVIVPLAAMWLHDYELWQATGIWYGPEAPHGFRSEDEARRYRDARKALPGAFKLPRR